jgi:monoterpene epsilon-lactone hydrolase
MSIRAEVLRLGLRFLLKRDDPHPDIAAMRQHMEAITRFIPYPPRGTRIDHLTVAGIPAIRVATPQSRGDRHMLYLHGGGYVFGSFRHYRDFIWRIADATEARILCIDYRLAPEHPFPAAVDDAASAYRWLLADGAEPRRTAVMGDSAGGGLAFGMLLKLRDNGIPLPAAAVALSPWTDLAMTKPVSSRIAEVDPMLSIAQGRTFAAAYLGGANPRTPYASPLYSDPTGLPPSLIQVGSDEILRGDSERMAERLRSAGCEVELQVWPRMPHVWHLFARILPEGRRGIAQVGDFVRRRLALPRPALKLPIHDLR